MKCVFKTATLAVIGGNNEFNDLYKHLMTDKNYPPHTARNAIARRIAALTLGVLKSGEKFKSYGERRNVDNKKIIS